jgi:hypothetical protein
MSCPICGKRPPKRYCPAKGEKICAVCCGREREVTIDCPLECSYLIAAHRYEAERRRAGSAPIPAEEYPYKGIEFSVDFVYQHWPLVGGIAAAILTFQSQHRDLNDSEIYSATERLAETYRTLGTGIYYERPPEALLPAALYGEIQRFLQQFRKAEAAHAGFTSLKDSEIFQLLVFLLRMNKAETNGRPRSRAFLEFLRARFPLRTAAGAGAPGAPAPESPRIIIP